MDGKIIVILHIRTRTQFHTNDTGRRNHPREELTKSAPESDPFVKAAAAKSSSLHYEDVNRRSSGQA